MGLTSRARGGLAGALALTAALIAVSIVSSSTASAATIVNEGAPPPKISKVFPNRSSVVSETIANPASADDYWTPERLASAVPAEMPNPSDALDIPDFASGASASADGGDFTPGNVTAFPQRVHGKIFFSVGVNNFSCSGTLIDSANQSVVFTAGHCVFDQETHGFVSNLIFLPGYENGVAQLGAANGASVFTTSQWAQSGANAYDMGVVVLDQPFEKFYGSRQIAFDLNPKGLNYTIYGYPSKPNPPYNGEVLQGCHSGFAGRDDGNGNITPYPVAASPCFMQQGASGGGWVVGGNYVNSVVSYGYCDSVPSTCGFIFGPYFSNAAKSLYVQAGGSPAPTIKLKSGPKGVVRKRTVNFQFTGSAATLLGFRCRFDRQKEVACSSKISIRRLSPGKHILRVWAVDQTGHKSKKPAVRSFRVVLPRR
ncbi:MAG TPA: trypsin-like serine protease [Solirubrobacterales bacterium]|nr:trypsin-like serine protease [Solirubrobacterales bacterium]